MLDVHPPHEAAHTWKDFFIHIATICVGLLIAIGLEQSVEWLHRKHQVAETRKAFAVERNINRRHFAANTQEFERTIHILQKDVSVFVALRDHPNVTAALPPLDWNVLVFDMQDAAWQRAKQSNVLESMPDVEARAAASLYDYLKSLNADEEAERQAIAEARLFAIVDADPSHLSVQQLDHQIELTARVIQTAANLAIDQSNLNDESPDFSPAPTPQEIFAIRHQVVSPDFITHTAQLFERLRKLDEKEAIESSSSK
jgi:hypothetical protein